MIDAARFNNLELQGGFIIVGLEITNEKLVDAIGREAIARTSITANQLHITIRAGLTDEELSVTVYHEILEAMTVATKTPPASILKFNESDFERAAYRAHEKLGFAAPETLGRMLQSYGFGEQ